MGEIEYLILLELLKAPYDPPVKVERVGDEIVFPDFEKLPEIKALRLKLERQERAETT